MVARRGESNIVVGEIPLTRWGWNNFQSGLSEPVGNPGRKRSVTEDERGREREIRVSLIENGRTKGDDDT